MTLTMAQIAGFWRQVDQRTLGECWPWMGPRNQAGYGRFTANGVRTVAHRVAYELAIGEIPEGLDVDHLCRNKACVNPRHLESVTRSVNMKRYFAALVHDFEGVRM